MKLFKSSLLLAFLTLFMSLIEVCHGKDNGLADEGAAALFGTVRVLGFLFGKISSFPNCLLGEPAIRSFAVYDYSLCHCAITRPFALLIVRCVGCLLLSFLLLQHGQEEEAR
jgi:hypothetical protein